MSDQTKCNVSVFENTNNAMLMDANGSEDINRPDDDSKPELVDNMSISTNPGSGRPSLDNACSEGRDILSYGERGMEPPSPLTGCYLLIILGEPHSDVHKNSILQHLLKGKRVLFKYLKINHEMKLIKLNYKFYVYQGSCPGTLKTVMSI